MIYLSGYKIHNFRSRDDNPRESGEDDEEQEKAKKEIEKAINYKKNRNNKMALALLSITAICLTMLGLIAFKAFPFPIDNLLQFSSYLGIFAGASIVGAIAISASNIVKNPEIKNKDPEIYDGVNTPERLREIQRQEEKQNRDNPPPANSKQAPVASWADQVRESRRSSPPPPSQM